MWICRKNRGANETMPEDKHGAESAKFIAAMDFASLASVQRDEHRRKMSDLLWGLIGVVDSLQALQRYLQELENVGQAQPQMHSVSGIIRQALRVLETSGVKPIQALGAPLDLESHEVVAIAESSHAQADIVVEETQSGYRWNDRLLRRSKVVVSSGSADMAHSETGLGG